MSELRFEQYRVLVNAKKLTNVMSNLDSSCNSQKSRIMTVV